MKLLPICPTPRKNSANYFQFAYLYELKVILDPPLSVLLNFIKIKIQLNRMMGQKIPEALYEPTRTKRIRLKRAFDPQNPRIVTTSILYYHENIVF